MQGKMILAPKATHSNKATDIRLESGRAVKSVQATYPEGAPLVWTRHIKL